MKRLILMVAMVLALSGCGVTLADLPLPGNSVSGSTYRVSATFEDALNLPIGAQVKLDGVSIGKVRSLKSRNFKAIAQLELKKAYPLHTGTQARLRSSTPLGELFVQITTPKSGSVLADGAALGTTATSVAPSIEDSMAATSMLLNGGNLNQLGSIVREANAALDGRQGNARDLLTQLTTTAKTLQSSTGDIDRTLAALAKVSTKLNQREATINSALAAAPGAAKVLHDNTARLTDLLSGIKDVGAVSQRVIAQTRTEILTILAQAGPILDQLVSIQGLFGTGLSNLVSFSTLLDKAVPTDYLNTYLHITGGIDVLPIGGLTGLVDPGTAAEDGAGTSDQGFGGLDLPDLGLGNGSAGSTGPDIGLSGLLGNLVGGKR